MALRVLVCGGREFGKMRREAKQLFRVLDALQDERGPLEIIEGGASGADYLAWCWAEINGVDGQTFPANWEANGKRAGPVRNQQMLDEGKPDLVIAFPGNSGTQDMVLRTLRRGIELIRPGSLPTPSKDNQNAE